MGRPRKNRDNDVDDNDSSGEAEERPLETESKIPDLPGVDIDDILNDVRKLYGTKQKHLASDLVRGSDVLLSTKDSDYVLSDRVDFWNPLTGIKGLPFGRIVQVSGKPDSGKSTTAMLFMVAAQYQGVLVILWDAEKKFSSSRFRDRIGGDPDKLIVTKNKLVIEGTKQVARIVKAAKEQNPALKILIVWDSVGSTLNSTEDDETNEDYTKQPGVTAREVSWAIKRLNKLVERYRNNETGEETISVLCINQSYATIGMGPSVQKEKGGQELEYLSSLILQLSRKKDLTKVRAGEKIKYGILTRAKVKKNHLFDGADCIAELDLVVSADGIKLANEARGDSSISGWDDDDE